MVAGIWCLAWPGLAGRRLCTRSERGGPGQRPPARCPSQSPLRSAVRVRVLRCRRAFGQCLPRSGAAYLCVGAKRGCLATGAHSLPGLRSLLLREQRVRTKSHRVGGFYICAAPGGTPDSLTRWWTVKPYVAAGVGRTFNGSAAVEGTPGGEFHVEGRFVFRYASRLAAAGDATIGPTRSPNTNYGTLQNGLEVRHPLGFDLKPDLGVSFIYYYFFPSAKFSLPGESPLEVSNQFEFGINIGSAKPAKLWIFNNPRIGVSYRFGDGLTGVRAQFGFPF